MNLLKIRLKHMDGHTHYHENDCLYDHYAHYQPYFMLVCKKYAVSQLFTPLNCALVMHPIRFLLSAICMGKTLHDCVIKLELVREVLPMSS